ncbi:MAG: FHA domain-containing protein [Myxococcota bacterium]
MIGHKQEIGFVCGRCGFFNALGTASCQNCGADLTLRVGAAIHGAPPAASSQPASSGRARGVPRPRPSSSKSYRGPSTKPPVTRGAVQVAEDKQVEPARHYVCRSCSSAVPAGHKFCGRCGTPVPQEIRELKTNFFGDMQNPTKAKLILIRGEGMDGLSFHLKAEQHIVGREGQLIFPDDPFVSPRHANFFYREGALVVRDEGSLNGVYIRIRGTVPIDADNTFLAGEQLFQLQKLDPINDDGPEADGTNFYASPRKDSLFRLCQIFRGNATGMTVHANGTSMTVGRDGADLNFPEDLFMSAEHCRIDYVNGQFTLTDLDSRNGTYVRIRGERKLDHGDYVFIGRKLLRVEVNTN